jgi:hypothetical protein
MSWSKYGEFLAFAVVLIVIPGPDFADHDHGSFAADIATFDP